MAKQAKPAVHHVFYNRTKVSTWNTFDGVYKDAVIMVGQYGHSSKIAEVELYVCLEPLSDTVLNYSATALLALLHLSPEEYYAVPLRLTTLEVANMNLKNRLLGRVVLATPVSEFVEEAGFPLLSVSCGPRNGYDKLPAHGFALTCLKYHECRKPKTELFERLTRVMKQRVKFNSTVLMTATESLTQWQKQFESTWLAQLYKKAPVVPVVNTEREVCVISPPTPITPEGFMQVASLFCAPGVADLLTLEATGCSTPKS